MNLELEVLESIEAPLTWEEAAWIAGRAVTIGLVVGAGVVIVAT